MCCAVRAISFTQACLDTWAKKKVYLTTTILRKQNIKGLSMLSDRRNVKIHRGMRKGTRDMKNGTGMMGEKLGRDIGALSAWCTELTTANMAALPLQTIELGLCRVTWLM
jgi:hypothetical protein